MSVHTICMRLSDNGGSERTLCILNTNAKEEYLLDAEHLTDRPGLLEVFPGDQLIVLNGVNDSEHQQS